MIPHPGLNRAKMHVVWWFGLHTNFTELTSHPSKIFVKKGRGEILTKVLPFQREVFESLTVTTEICLKWSEEAQIA